MNTRFLLLAALGAFLYGCATPEETAAPTAAAAAAPAAKSEPVRYRPRPTLTGSRLAPLDDDDTGSHTVGGVTKDEYMNMDAARVKPLNGEGGAAAGGRNF